MALLSYLNRSVILYNFELSLHERNPSTNTQQAKKIKTQAERSPQDKIDIEFDQYSDFEVCAASYTPIYSNSPSVACPYDGAKYHTQFKGQVCKVCEVCEIGAPAGGLRLFTS